MDNRFNCECGVNILKTQLSRHKKTKKHLDFVNNKTLDLTKHEDKEDKDEDEDNEQTEQDERAETSESDEEVEVKYEEPKKNYNKTHLDIIRKKAIESIKNKKQAKINKEIEIKQKAEQYDVLVKSLKEKEENEKKRKEEERLKEMEYKSQQYDKLMKNQEKNNAIKQLSNEKIIDSVKQQRLEYLIKYLQNPSMY